MQKKKNVQKFDAPRGELKTEKESRKLVTESPKLNRLIDSSSQDGRRERFGFGRWVVTRSSIRLAS